MLAAALNKVGSVYTMKVAGALEDMTYDRGGSGAHAREHQLLPQVVNTIAPVDGMDVFRSCDAASF